MISLPLKKAVISVAMLLVLLVSGVLVTVALIDLDSYKPQISASVKQLTGRDFHIAGPIAWRPGLSTDIVIDQVYLGNQANAKHQHFAEVEQIAASVDLLSFLTGELVIEDIGLFRPQIWLEVDETGKGNWQFDGDHQAGQQAAGKAAFSHLPKLQISEGQIHFHDAGQNHTATYRIDDFQSQGLLVSDIFSFELNMQLEGINLFISASIDTLLKLINQQTAAIAANARFDQREIKLVASLEVTEQGVFLNDFDLQLDGSHVGGYLHYDMHAVPASVDAEIAFDSFNLDALLKPGRHPARQENPADIFSKQVFNTGLLQNRTAHIALKGQKLSLHDLTVTDFSGLLQLADNSLHIESGMTLQEGTLQGQIDYDFKPDMAKLTSRIQGRQLDLARLLKPSGNSAFVGGSAGRLDAAFSSSGNSPHQLAGNLHGRLLIDLGSGKLLNEDLNLMGGDLATALMNALNPAAKRSSYTDIECAVINLNFKKGVSVYDKSIAAMTDRMSVVSSGRIDLGKETLDMRFLPRPRKDAADLGINVGEIAGMVKLSGKINDPQLALDAANTARAGVKVYGAVATGGISLLVDGLVSKLISDANPCETARGETVRGNATGNTPTAPAQKKSGLREFFGF